MLFRRITIILRYMQVTKLNSIKKDKEKSVFVQLFPLSVNSVFTLG